MTDPTSFLETIRQAYPHLPVENVRLNQDGQYNDVLIVNDEYIFRFAKFVEGITALRRETMILNHIQEQLTLAIPQPIFQYLEIEEVGKAFTGYRMLPGQPLWWENYEAIQNATALERMAHQLATFLRELHAIPIEASFVHHLPVADQLPEWHDLYKRIQHSLFPHMRVEAKEQVRDHFENYFSNPHRYHFDPVLRHGDFGTGNLLYDPATLAITGVIDFGATTLGDPAIDFAGLFSFGESFCEHCYAVYPELRTMLERVHFYRGTFALQEALYGAENNDMEAFARGIEGYQ